MQYSFNQYTHLDAGPLQDSPGLDTVRPRIWHKHVSGDIINVLKPNCSSTVSEKTVCRTWIYNTRADVNTTSSSTACRTHALHTSYVYSTHCQQGNYLKMFSLYHIMQIVAHEHELPITKSSNCRYRIFRVQSFISRKAFFFTHHNSPDYNKMGLFSESAERPFVTYLKRGDMKHPHALNQSEAYLNVRCDKPKLRKTHQFHALGNTTLQ